jgi:hypothetical protein
MNLVRVVVVTKHVFEVNHAEKRENLLVTSRGMKKNAPETL